MLKSIDKSNQLFRPKNVQNSSFSFINLDFSFYSIENKEKNVLTANELKNPYLKKDDIPELEFIDKNNIIICSKKEYEIKNYIEKINCAYNDFLEDEIYNYCGKCKNNLNKFFCFICQKNICEKCYEECKINKHIPQNLDDINDKNNLDKIKIFLNNLIIPIKEDEKIIKDIVQYIDKYIINNDIKNNNSKYFSSVNNNEKNEDILLIYQIVTKDYINYIHFLNI